MSHAPARSRARLAAGLGLFACAVLTAPASADPIAAGAPTSLPQSVGGPVAPKSIPASHPPQNPFLAHDPYTNIHDDTWMTDAYAVAGPLGRRRRHLGHDAARALRLAHVRPRGRIVSVCPSVIARPQARIIDPDTLAIIGSYDLPNAPDPAGTKAYQNFAGGGYFFLDRKDRIWSADQDRPPLVLAEASGGTARQEGRLRPHRRVGPRRADDLRAARLPGPHLVRVQEERHDRRPQPEDRRDPGQAPRRGDRELLRRRPRRRLHRLRQAHVPLQRRQGRQAAESTGRSRYRNSGIVKPSQVDAGSGTTPTIMDGGYVAITDNADPMNVVVYRRARKLHGAKRVVCQVPVFDKGASATENSLIDRGPLAVRREQLRLPGPVRRKAGASPSPASRGSTSTPTARAAPSAGRTPTCARPRSCRSSRPRPA